MCYKCASKCIDHQDKIKFFPLDKDILQKRSYIIEKIKDKNQTYIDDENNTLNKNYSNSEEDNCDNKDLIGNDTEINNDNDKSDEDEDDCLIIKKINSNIIINDEAKDKIKNIINKNNNDELLNEEYYLINLFTIIVDDFQNYPNKELNLIIDNLEKFIFLNYDNSKKIDLKYEFEKEDIKDDLIKILGKKFVENNKDKCKIIYNDKEKELKEYYEEFNNMNVIKFKLKFIKKIIDMSYMFEM
jgi:hypothetical protein